MFCLLKRVSCQSEIHNSEKGTVSVNQAGLGLSDVHLRAIIEPLIGKVGNLHKKRRFSIPQELLVVELV